MLMKNKVTRDLQHSERVNEDKLKQFKSYMNETFSSAEVRTETTFDLIKEKQLAMNEKLSKVEETEFVIDFVRTEVRKIDKSINEKLNANSKALDERFQKLLHEELTYEDVQQAEDGTISGKGLLFGKNIDGEEG